MGNTVENFRLLGHTVPRLDTYFRLPQTVTIHGTLGTRGGADSDGVMVGDLTQTAVGIALQDDGGTFTDDTTDVNDAGANDVAVFPTTEAANDAFYYGDVNHAFAGINVDIGTAGVDTAGSPVVRWEYWNGAAWVNLATAHALIDGTNGGNFAYEQDGFVTWALPTDWVKTTVNGTSAFWVRSRLHSGAYDTTNPLVTQAFLLRLNSGHGPAAPAHGYLTNVSWNAGTVSAGNNDTILNIINVTRGEGTSVTITQAVNADDVAVALTNGLYFERDDEIVIMVAQEDGTTEFANLELTLRFKV